MITDPEIIRAIDDYFANGGTVLRIPFGVSGVHQHNVECSARHFGFLSWARRYGRDLFAPEIVEYLEAGVLTLVQVRAPVVWKTIHAAGSDGLSTEAISKTISVAEAGVRRSLLLLEHRRLALGYRRSRYILYRALGDQPPSWQEFMAKPRRAA